MNALKLIVTPEKIPSEYWKKVLWVALDLRRAVCENNKMGLNLLNTKHVTLLFVRPHGRFQLAYSIACDLLNVRKTMYRDSNFENQNNPSDSGRVLSHLTDMLVIHGLHHDVLSKIVSCATIPVFSASSDVYCLQKALSDMMTYYEVFHRLKGLTVAWVGPPNSIFNSYLVLCSHFGMQLRYTLICRYGAGKMSPVHNSHYEKNDTISKDFSLKEVKTAVEAVEGANIVATSMHPEEYNKITLEVLKKAAPDYVFMHSLPRGTREAAPDVFFRENDLTWKTSENYFLVAMAIILTSLKDYQPRIPMPIF